MRALGLDVGSKTVGVAVSDGLGVIAQPLVTLARKGTAADAAAVVRLVREREAEALVFGLPLELSGEEGPRARRVRVLLDAVRDALAQDARLAPVRVETWDERFSTVAAERALLEADLSRARRKQVVDKVAAAYILQGWLDAHRAAAGAPSSGSPAGEEGEP